MILSLAIITTKICIFVGLVLLLFEFFGAIWLIDISHDIKNHNRSRRVNRKRAKRCFRYLKKTTTMLILVAILGIVAYIDVISGGRENDIETEVCNNAVRVLQFPYI